MDDGWLFGSEVTCDLKGSKRRVVAILVNRWSDELSEVWEGLHVGPVPSGLVLCPFGLYSAVFGPNV